MSISKNIRYKVSSLLGKRAIQNVLWLSFDKFFKLGLSIVIGAWAARMYGPADLGKINYVNAYIAIFVSICTLGMDSFLVKEILSNNVNTKTILGSALLLRLTSSISIFFGGYIFFKFYGVADEYSLLYLFLAMSLLFSPFDLIDIEYQSKLQSKKTVVAKNSAYLFGALLKIIILTYHRSIVCYAVAFGIETVLAYAILVAQYQRRSKPGMFAWKINLRTSIAILKKGWPFTITALSVILYMRVDQIMIGNYLSVKEVGVFTGATKLSEVFTFIPSAVTSSYYMTLMASVNANDRTEYIRKNKVLFNLLLAISVGISSLMFLFAKPIILILSGRQFMASIPVLRVHTWSLIAIFLGMASGPYFAIENLQKIAFYKTISGLIINVCLNFLLIPRLGAVGAAYATLFSQFYTSVFGHLLFKETRPVFVWQIESFRSLLTLKINDFKL